MGASAATTAVEDGGAFYELTAVEGGLGATGYQDVGIVALSLADLALTTMYLTSVGMAEGNPIAAWLIVNTQSLWVLALYKGVTVATCVSLLYYMRNSRQGELASWCSMLIMTALSIWWNQYALYQPHLPASDDQIVMVRDNPTNTAGREPHQAPTLLQ